MSGTESNSTRFRDPVNLSTGDSVALVTAEDPTALASKFSFAFPDMATAMTAAAAGQRDTADAAGATEGAGAAESADTASTPEGNSSTRAVDAGDSSPRSCGSYDVATFVVDAVGEPDFGGLPQEGSEIVHGRDDAGGQHTQADGTGDVTSAAEPLPTTVLPQSDQSDAKASPHPAS